MKIYGRMEAYLASFFNSALHGGELALSSLNRISSGEKATFSHFVEGCRVHWSRSGPSVKERNLLFLPGVIWNIVGSSAV
jgi:hypothetical protein